MREGCLERLSRHLKIDKGMEVERSSAAEMEHIWLNVEHPLEHIPLQLKFDEISEQSALDT